MAENNNNTSRILADAILIVFSKRTMIFLSLIMSGGFLIRLYYIPYDLPISLDGISYFVYAVETSRLGHLPSGYILANNGWPVFVSFFFSLFNFDSFLDYILLQRYLAVTISVLTVIPVYLLCRKFVESHFALVGVTIFTFEPRLVQNSIAGLTEALFILLGSLTLLLFFSKNTKLTYISFSVAALFALVRFEGLLIIIPLSVMFFIKHHKQQKIYLKFVLASGIFLLTLAPMVYARIETTGQDGLVSQFVGGGLHVSQYVVQGFPEDDDPYPQEWKDNKLAYFLGRGTANLLKFVVLAMIPHFIIFVPLAVLLIAKDHWHKLGDYRVITMILMVVFLLIPAFYAYGRGIQEVRYIFVLFPIFTLISCYLIRKILLRCFGVILILILSLILLSSIAFLEINKPDYEHEREAYMISLDIVKYTDIINADPVDGNYLKVARILQKWPDIDADVLYKTDKILASNFQSIDEYINKNRENGLTHLVSDGKDHGAIFIKNIFYNERQYPYLKKIYDSTENGYKYHVKIYEINYDVFSTYSEK